MTLYIGQPNTDPVTGGLLHPINIEYPDYIETANKIEILDHPDNEGIHHTYSITQGNVGTVINFKDLSPIDLLVVVENYYNQVSSPTTSYNSHDLKQALQKQIALLRSLITLTTSYKKNFPKKISHHTR